MIENFLDFQFHFLGCKSITCFIFDWLNLDFQCIQQSWLDLFIHQWVFHNILWIIYARMTCKGQWLAAAAIRVQFNSKRSIEWKFFLLFSREMLHVKNWIDLMLNYADSCLQTFSWDIFNFKFWSSFFS